jgi:Txe/YoeB family toxin of Txe-Axe toxin-antitoxin module
MILPSKIQFTNDGVKKAFERLREGKGNEKKIYEWLIRAFEDIEKNAFCGIQIPKKLIPLEYIKKFNIKNVWKYNLPDAWRLLYSVENDQLIVISIVLEWLDHKSYERRFGY